MVQKGIAVAKLSAATAAALADQDPDVAAMTAGNAVKHNAFFIPLIMVGSAAWTAYEVIEEFYTNGTEAGLKKLGIEIGMYAAGGAVTKLGTKVVMAGVKVAGNPKVGQFIAKIGDKYIPFNSIDAVWKHAVQNSSTLQLAMKCVEKSKLYLGKATQKAAHLDQAAGEKVSQLADRGLNHAKKRLGGGPAPKGGSGSGSGGSGAPRNHKNNNKKSNDKGKEPAAPNPIPASQSYFSKGTISGAKIWTKSGKLKDAQLPTQGKIRFVPESNWNATTPIPRGPNKGFIDKFGNEWTKGPSRTAGQNFEWDVQLSSTGHAKLGWASRDGRHINVSLDGKITHK